MNVPSVRNLYILLDNISEFRNVQTFSHFGFCDEMSAFIEYMEQKHIFMI